MPSHVRTKSVIYDRTEGLRQGTLDLLSSATPPCYRERVCVCDGTGILFEEPNPTGSRPSDLIGLYEMARKAKGTVTFHTRLKQEEATALVYLYTSLQHSISALVLTGAHNPFSVKNKKKRSADRG